MQAVRADDEIETPGRRALERDIRPARVLVDRNDLIAEHDLGSGGGPVEHESGKDAARDGDEAAASQRANGRHAKSGELFAAVANDAKLADVVACGVEVAPEPHALGDVIAEAPEVDDVASCPEIGRPFDKRGFEAGGGEPEGERRPGDPRA